MNNKQAYCGYLYADGHAVMLWKKNDKDAGEVQFAEVWEKLGPVCHFDGRLVIHNPTLFFRVVQNAKRVDASEPSLKHGSENTKKMGIAVGYVTVGFSESRYFDSISFSVLDGILSGDFCYQPNVVETFDGDKSYWGDVKIAKWHRLPVQTPKVEAVAA